MDDSRANNSSGDVGKYLDEIGVVESSVSAALDKKQSCGKALQGFASCAWEAFASPPRPPPA